MLHRTAKQQLIIAQVFSLMALQKEQSRRLHAGVVLLMFEAGCRTHIARSFSVGPAGRVDVGHPAGAHLVGHLKLGAYRPSATLMGALQAGPAQKNMLALARANPHTGMAVGADQFVSAHWQAPARGNTTSLRIAKTGRFIFRVLPGAQGLGVKRRHP